MEKGGFMKNLTTVIFVFLILMNFTLVSAQVPITIGDLIQIDFTGFTGAGFDPEPAAGQLNSNEWIITGMSDGSMAYGESRTSGDFARGTSSGGVTTGGCYSFNLGTGDASLGFQPAGSDFNPGTAELRLQNLTGSILNRINIQYDIYVYNDQARANSFNFSYSENGTDFTAISGLDYTSPEAADATPAWVQNTRTTSITGLNVANNGFLYLRWTGVDVSGSGSRDEFALDNILISEGDTPLPVELTSFTARAGDQQVTLRWATAAEIDNQGFAILRSASKTSGYSQIDSYQDNPSLKGAGNSSEARQYQFTDRAVINGMTYWYKLVDVDFNGHRTEHGPVFATPHAAEIAIDPLQGILPEVFALNQNYPNPFNPATKINFAIPVVKDGVIGVKITVFDMLGQRVKTLLESPMVPGVYEIEWDGTNDLGQIVPSGVYVYNFESALFSSSRKMVLMR